jgi:hypothetical protein
MSRRAGKSRSIAILFGIGMAVALPKLPGNHLTTMRIGLFTPATHAKKGSPTTTTTYVEVVEIADLAEKLKGLGAKRVGLLKRDRLGTTQLEGSMFTLDQLKPEHLTWVSTKPAEFETRGIFYDSK